MKKIAFLMAILVCCFLVFKLGGLNKEPKYCRYVNQVSGAFISFAKKKYDLTCSSKGGALLDKVNEIFLSFNSTGRELEVDEARILLVNCVEEFLDIINRHGDIQPYLEHTPFSSRGLEVGISFFDESRKRVNENYIGRVAVLGGKVFYSVYNHEKGLLLSKHEESYEEARRIVLGE